MKRFAIGLLVSNLMFGIAWADQFKADVWADNWFALYVDGDKVGEDSVPVTTERSFNAESFSFSASKPFVLGLVAKDFKENDTGLEYIGTRRQQMGDGGVILQITDSSGNLVAATDKSWRCLVLHEAPLQKSCATESNPVAGSGACGFSVTKEPAGWQNAGFDDSNWLNASQYRESDVRPKDGYDHIRWHSAAKLVWGPDLETNNTLICRKQIGN